MNSQPNLSQNNYQKRININFNTWLRIILVRRLQYSRTLTNQKRRSKKIRKVELILVKWIIVQEMQLKLKGILEKTKSRLRNQGLGKDNKFSKKFDKFQDLDTFIDIKELISNLIKQEKQQKQQQQQNQVQKKQKKIVTVPTQADSEDSGDENYNYGSILKRSKEFIQDNQLRYQYLNQKIPGYLTQEDEVKTIDDIYRNTYYFENFRFYQNIDNTLDKINNQKQKNNFEIEEALRQQEMKEELMKQLQKDYDTYRRRPTQLYQKTPVVDNEQDFIKKSKKVINLLEKATKLIYKTQSENIDHKYQKIKDEKLEQKYEEVQNNSNKLKEQIKNIINKKKVLNLFKKVDKVEQTQPSKQQLSLQLIKEEQDDLKNSIQKQDNRITEKDEVLYDNSYQQLQMRKAVSLPRIIQKRQFNSEHSEIDSSPKQSQNKGNNYIEIPSLQTLKRSRSNQKSPNSVLRRENADLQIFIFILNKALEHALTNSFKEWI